MRWTPRSLVAAGITLIASQSVDAQVRLPMRDGFVQAEPGVRLYYQAYGSGRDTIVVLHGGPGFGLNYLAPDLLPLARRRTVIFYDQRTAGRSTLVADTARNDATTSVADLDAVRRHFSLRKLTLIGHSWGSLLAGLYASRYPERVARMVLVASSPPAKAVSDSLPRVAARLDSAHRAWRARHEQRWRQGAADSIKACWDYWAINIRLYYATATDARAMWGDVCNMEQATLLTRTRGHPHLSLSNARFDLRPSLRRVTAPVLVVHGEHDVIAPLSAREWAAALPNSRLVIIAGAGHFPHVDAPRTFFDTLERFLSVSSAQPPRSTYAELFDAISARNGTLADAINAGRWVEAAEVYDPRAILLAPGAPPIHGRAAIASFWRSAHGKGLRRVALHTIEVERDRDLVVESGKYALHGANDALLDRGKYLVVWRLDRGVWRIDRDAFNSSLEHRSPLEQPDYLAEPLGTMARDTTP